MMAESEARCPSALDSRLILNVAFQVIARTTISAAMRQVLDSIATMEAGVSGGAVSFGCRTLRLE